jgi:predicted transcriptional regulator
LLEKRSPILTKTSIQLPPDLIASLDALAARRRVSRNRLIAEACKKLVREDPGEWPQGFFTRNDLSAADLRTLRAAGRGLESVLRRRRNRRMSPFP